MSAGHRQRTFVRTALGLAAAVAVALVSQQAPTSPRSAVSAVSAVTRVDPSALAQGAPPGVVHLVRDTIHDGALTVPAPRRGQHKHQSQHHELPQPRLPTVLVQHHLSDGSGDEHNPAGAFEGCTPRAEL